MVTLFGLLNVNSSQPVALLKYKFGFIETFTFSQNNTNIHSTVARFLNRVTWLPVWFLMILLMNERIASLYMAFRYKSKCLKFFLWRSQTFQAHLKLPKTRLNVFIKVKVKSMYSHRSNFKTYIYLKRKSSNGVFW